MNDFIIQLFRSIESRGIRYCHFKSNNNLEPALSGVDDLDLLVAMQDKESFSAVVAQAGFRLATDRGLAAAPFVFHYYGPDPATGLLVHLHVYFRLVTGGSILKNHWIPLERAFLDSARPIGAADVYIPSANADLVLFVLRKFIEQPSLIEHFLFLRDIGNIRAEISWLMERADRPGMRALVEQWLPQVPINLFDACLDALVDESSSIAQRVRLGMRIRRCIRTTVIPPLFASLARSYMFALALIRGKLRIDAKDRSLFPGGLLVAFVGSEASGKSTLSRDAAKWLGRQFDLAHIHVGKPPKSWRTLPLWWAIAVRTRLRRLLGGNAVSRSAPEQRIAANLPHPIICWLDSIDRRQWVMKNARRMLNGTIVITDRYPAQAVGGMDGARIVPNSRLTHLLSRWERKNYSGLPQPDLVLKVVAPLDVALARNAERKQPEPEGFIRQRFELAKALDFIGSEVVQVDTNKPLEDTARLVRLLVWNAGGASPVSPRPMARGKA